MRRMNCPRCDSQRTIKISDSPVKGKWEVYRCEDCFYAWRTSEDLADIVKKVPYWRENAIRYW